MSPDWILNEELELIISVHEKSIFYAPRLYLFDLKYCKNVKYYLNLKQVFSMWICVKL